MISAGMLRHRVRIEVMRSTQDSTGQVIEQWRPIADRVPCAIEWQSGSETTREPSEQRDDRYLVTFRPRRLAPGWRLVARQAGGNELTLRVESVGDPKGLRRLIVATCSSVAEGTA